MLGGRSMRSWPSGSPTATRSRWRFPAVANDVVHAYRDRGADAEPGHGGGVGRELVVAVSDEGMGLTPRPDSPGPARLPIIATLADRFEVHKVGQWARFLMGFRLAGIASEPS
jgi:hypothetical protein